MLKKIYIVTVIMVFAAGMAFAAPADVPKTGQTTSYGTGAIDDGALQRGVAWPSPRFTVTSGIGTVVTDNLTGLMWAGDGGTPALSTLCAGGVATWQGALDYVACLNTNDYLGYADWRLPNVDELESLVHAEYTKETTCGGACTTNAAWLNTQGFSNVQAYFYWSSTTYGILTSSAWEVDMVVGEVYTYDKTASNFYVWPVRSGK